MKRILVSLIIISLLLIGCGQKNLSKEGSFNQEFSEFLDETLVEMMGTKSHAINFFFREPEAYGIKPDLYEVAFTSGEEYQEEIEDVKKLIKKVNEFKDGKISPQQRLDKKVLLESLNNTVALKDYYDYVFGGSVIGPQRSLMASFASELEAYTFRVKQDVEAYLNLIETFPAQVNKHIQLELDRIENGTGFGKEEIEEILSVYKDSANDMKKDNYFLLAHFDKEMDKAVFLSDDERLAFKSKHRELVKDNLAQAYEDVIAKMSNVEANPTIGLANKPGGKKYFEILLKQSTGRDYAISEVEKFIEELQAESYMTFAAFGEAKVTQYLAKLAEEKFANFANGEALLDNIASNYKNDFPSIKELNYEIRKVDASMSQSAAPAFYFIPSVDYDINEKQVIYINGDFDNKLFTTYAHEGLPGHMYQYSYFMEIEGMHPIRHLVGLSSNAEGWATYASIYATRYIFDEEYHKFYEAMEMLQNIVMVKADIGINYYGWDLNRFSKFMLEYYTLDKDDPAIKKMYVQLANIPSVSATYSLSSMYIWDLKLMVRQELDEKYSDLGFHRAFLDAGSASFNIIEQELLKYIAEECKK